MSITTQLTAADNGLTSRTVLNDNFTAVEVAIEAVVNSGAPLATTSVAGRSRLSTAPVDATVPIAVGTNDTRMNVGAGMTADEKAALAGGGTYGTPSGSNKFVTEQFTMGRMSFGSGSDGAVTISAPTTLVRDMYYQSLVVTDTLTTDGYTIYVQDAISGTGTIRHTNPAPGNGGAGVAGTRAGGGSGASGGIVLIFAGTWAGTFTIQSTGSVGGTGATGGVVAGSAGAGAAGAERGAGQFKGTVGVAGVGNGGSGSADIFGSAGLIGTPQNPSISVSGAAGGKGGDAGARGGGNGGVGGIATAPNTANWSIYRFLVSALLDINSSGALIKLLSSPSGGGGGAGSAENIPTGSGGGGGGAGGSGGVGVVIFKLKTWTGAGSFAGGAGGVGGVATGAPNTNGVAGSTGVAGSLIEINWNNLI